MKKMLSGFTAVAAIASLAACGPSAPRIHCTQINPTSQQLSDLRAGGEVEVFDDYNNECELRGNGRFVVDD